MKPLSIVLSGIAAAALAVPARAEAGPLADAIKRHAPADVDALRAQLPGDASIRCTLGAVYAKRADLSRAALYLTDCEDEELPEDISLDVLRATRDNKKKVTEQLAQLSIVSEPAGMIAELDALAGEKLTTPTEVWVKAGTHTVRASGGGKAIQNSIKVEPYTRQTIFLDSGTRPAPPPSKKVIQIEDDNIGEQTTGGPPDIKHPSLIKGRYTGELGPAGEQLDDPLAYRPGAGIQPWFGLRLGGGVFDDASTTPSYRPSVAIAARFGLAPRLFLAARLDWSRRGGSAETAIDTAGVSLGAGTTIVGTRAVALALIGQLRGDLRFADARAMVPVRRSGAAAAVSLELAFPSTPLTAGLRLEQGLTELVEGARDRAVLVEVGVDWR